MRIISHRLCELNLENTEMEGRNRIMTFVNTDNDRDFMYLMMFCTIFLWHRLMCSQIVTGKLHPFL